MKRKFIVVVLALAMVFALTACGSGSESSDAGSEKKLSNSAFVIQLISTTLSRTSLRQQVTT
jgi:ABC-type glycerol-3-phosphate transport system substrate-binding protein